MYFILHFKHYLEAKFLFLLKFVTFWYNSISKLTSDIVKNITEIYLVCIGKCQFSLFTLKRIRFSRNNKCGVENTTIRSDM